jgi:hypothetical protein
MNLVVADSPWLSEQAQEIKDLECSLERKTHEVRKRQGEILLAVKETLGHGRFTEWLKGLGWSDRTARHYIQQYKGVDKPKQIEAARPNLELIEAEVVEIEDDDLSESAHSKSARFAVLEDDQEDELESFVDAEYIAEQEALPIIEAIQDIKQDESDGSKGAYLMDCQTKFVRKPSVYWVACEELAELAYSHRLVMVGENILDREEEELFDKACKNYEELRDASY